VVNINAIGHPQDAGEYLPVFVVVTLDLDEAQFPRVESVHSTKAQAFAAQEHYQGMYGDGFAVNVETHHLDIPNFSTDPAYDPSQLKLAYPVSEASNELA
jgi:hypothetical protein